MKESIAQVWITALVITFMLIFSGYLAVTISYSSTVKLKNGVLSIIEKRYGITSRKGIAKESPLTSKTVYSGFGTLEAIELYLRGNAYKNKGPCTEGLGDSKNSEENEWYGVFDIYSDNSPVKVQGNTATVGSYDKINVMYEKAVSGKKYYYCFAKVHENGHTKAEAYYKIRLFYQLELPIVNGLIFAIDGKTNMIARPSYCEIDVFKASNVNGTCPKRDGEG